MPKVSIILPTYNGEQYLQQALDSILTQTYADWELIVVDDCSTDRTANIINQYCKYDSRIHVIHNDKNQRLPRALNIGFAIATGQYLTWTSDDNLYMPNAIAVMVEYLDKYKDVYMVNASMNFIDEDGCILGESEIYQDRKMYTFNCLGACFMYRKEVYLEVGDYNPDMFCVEDYDYWLRVLKHFGRIVPIGETLYQYRRHKDSLSETRKKQVRDQLTKLRIYYINQILDVLNDNKSELCKIYYEMRKSDCMTKEVIERFKQMLPELCGEVFITDKKYIIFGSGKYGERAALSLGNDAVFFADSNLAKEGEVKCGLKILAFHNAIRLAKDYCFLIAVAEKTVYEMIVQLWRAGIREYSVFDDNLYGE
ncbi:MAG: glycosyltransferase [Lachnospiraceae bacterium]|nr:glycosyltransferase [Lachnospiraceae bacterium]